MDTPVQDTSNPKKRTQVSETVTTALLNDSVNQPALKKRKTKKITMSKELAEKRNANSKTRFNSLPMKLKCKILLRLDSYDLIEMKEVCSHWFEIIRQLLEVKEVDIPYERKYGDTSLRAWILDKTSFNVYQARFPIKYLMNRGIIANVLDRDMDCELEQFINADWLFITLKDLAINICRRLELDGHAEWEDVMWSYVLRLTGEERSIEDLKKEGTKGNFAQYIMKKYAWFSWTDEENFSEREHIGLITLQPDRKTFAVLHFPNIEQESEDDFDDFYGCGFDSEDDF